LDYMMYRVLLPLAVDGVEERRIFDWMGKYEYGFEPECKSFLITREEDMLAFKILFRHSAISFEKIDHD
jgi:hypothetical protein